MSNVRVLVGTRKGAFVLSSDGKREKWDVSGPHFAGWEIYHLKGSPADPNRLYASQCSGWFGQIIQRSDDGGKTWIQPGTPPGERTTPEGMPKGESNKFVYDPLRQREITHHSSVVRRHPASVGVQARLASRTLAYRSGYGLRRSRGRRLVPLEGRWQSPGTSFPDCAAMAPGHAGSPRRGGLCLHTIILDPKDPSRIYIAISAAGAFRTDDGGKTWRPINQGTALSIHPRPHCEIGHCVHHVAMHPSRPNVLFMQKHWDVMRSDNAGDLWQEVSGNLPTDFGFVIDVARARAGDHLRRPHQERRGALSARWQAARLPQPLSGNEWEALTKGLPQNDCYVNVLRDAMAVDSLDKCGVYSAPPAARCTPRPTPETPGPHRATPSRRTFCRGPDAAVIRVILPGHLRTLARVSDEVQLGRQRSHHAALGARRPRGPVSDAARDHPRTTSRRSVVRSCASSPARKTIPLSRRIPRFPTPSHREKSPSHHWGHRRRVIA